VNADAKHKLIRHYEVTDASVHDSRKFYGLLNKTNTSANVYADSAYRSAATEAKLKMRGLRSRIHQRAAGLWGKAGQRSLQRSALVEAAEQLTRALAQITALTATPALRREQVRLQVALANCLMHAKGYAAPETKAAIEQARLFIERAEALGEPPEDPLLLFSTLYGVWAANFVAFNGHVCRDLAAQFLTLAEKKEPRLRF
jgi:predicted ATPase